jgi:hypothetical protein
MSPEMYKERIEYAESQLQSREDTIRGGSARYPTVTIARLLRSYIEIGMTKGTFNERETTVSDLIDQIGKMLEASGFLSLRSQREAWYHACGVDAP